MIDFSSTQHTLIYSSQCRQDCKSFLQRRDYLEKYLRSVQNTTKTDLLGMGLMVLGTSSMLGTTEHWETDLLKGDLMVYATKAMEFIFIIPLTRRLLACSARCPGAVLRPGLCCNPVGWTSIAPPPATANQIRDRITCKQTLKIDIGNGILKRISFKDVLIKILKKEQHWNFK